MRYFLALFSFIPQSFVRQKKYYPCTHCLGFCNLYDWYPLLFLPKFFQPTLFLEMHTVVSANMILHFFRLFTDYHLVPLDPYIYTIYGGERSLNRYVGYGIYTYYKIPWRNLQMLNCSWKCNPFLDYRTLLPWTCRNHWKLQLLLLISLDLSERLIPWPCVSLLDSSAV